jgi:SAM-dependent methyltransferase
MPSDNMDPPVRNFSHPPIRYDERRLSHANIFRETFGHLSDDEWLGVLKRSVHEPVIDDVDFPRFPDPDLQSLLHGSAGENAIHEAFQFYLFIRSRLGSHLKLGSGARMLDFGCGWGRMSRPFMRHYDLADIYGFEPSRLFCTVAREMNPYICILNGEYLPNRRIPRNAFELIIGYSVFSHLSPHAAALWLREVAELLNPGGFAVLTTWGARFLNHLAFEKKRLDAGEDVHWYSKWVLDRFGEIDPLLERHRAGEFLWVDTGQTPLYGEAFVGLEPLKRLIAEHMLPLEVVAYDEASLPQDAFILRRT